MPSDRNQSEGVGTEPGATGAKTNHQKRQDTNRCRDERQAHELLTTLLPTDLDRVTAAQQNDEFCSL